MNGSNTQHRSSGTMAVLAFRAAEDSAALAKRLDPALSGEGIEWELVIVDDDSGAGIESVAANLAKRLPVRLEVRGERPRDRSLAVLRGVELAKLERIVVMDADLSHPPERIGRLLGALEGDCEMALGSRDLPGGLIDGAWSSGRLLNSRATCALTRPLVECSDPVSGFFAVHRRALPERRVLRPVGCKVGLELIGGGHSG